MTATSRYVKYLFNRENLTITQISSKLRISQMTVCCLLAEVDN